MLDRKTFAKKFGQRAVFGMVHLLPLPGAPDFSGSMNRIIDGALRDAGALVDGGCDGLVVENFGDKPFFASRVPAETIAAMTRVISQIAAEHRVAIGVNVLRNDAHAALAIAAAVDAAFIRINIHTGVMVADQGIIQGEAAETLRLRRVFAPDVAIFADHLVKHATPLGNPDPMQSVRDLRLRGLADAIIITGSETGAAADPRRLALVREAIDAPLVVGSGLTDRNANTFRDADAAIVGTSIKRGGRVDAPVDRARVEKIVKRFKAES